MFVVRGHVYTKLSGPEKTKQNKQQQKKQNNNIRIRGRLGDVRCDDDIVFIGHLYHKEDAIVCQ